MKRIAALLFIFVSASVIVSAQQRRIYTNPNPEDHARRIFPGAVAFSPLEGTPLHYKAYAQDPKTTPGAKPIGYVFWTTDLVPREHGYHGPIHFLVAMDLAGIIKGVHLDYHGEPYGDFSIEPPKFVAQFTNKRIRDPFRVGGDVDAVSRATITITSATRAIRDSSRMMAKHFLDPAAVK